MLPTCATNPALVSRAALILPDRHPSFSWSHPTTSHQPLLSNADLRKRLEKAQVLQFPQERVGSQGSVLHGRACSFLFQSLVRKEVG